MIKYKIEEYDLYGKQDKQDVQNCFPSKKSSGYFIWVLNVLAKSFQCKASYQGRINNNNCIFKLWGFSQDIELCLPIAEGLLFYIENMIQDCKECYVGSEDFRIFKREYYSGFSDGLKESLNKA